MGDGRERERERERERSKVIIRKGLPSIALYFGRRVADDLVDISGCRSILLSIFDWSLCIFGLCTHEELRELHQRYIDALQI